MPKNVVDYTTWRKGTKVTRATKIEVCPKCGRKGEKSWWVNKQGEITTYLYTHKGHIEMGMFFIVDDQCMIAAKEDKDK